METFQKLKLYIPIEKESFFFTELRKNIESSNWKMRNELAENYHKHSFTKQSKIFCVESPELFFNENIVQGILWMWDYNDYFEIFNIIPTKSNFLKHNEYNYILNEFNEVFIKNLCEKYSIRAELSTPEKFIIDTIGNDAFESLKSFSNNANHATGNIHPYDFNRWCDFIFIIFRKQIELNTDELINWLNENGWNEEMSQRLGLEFEYSLNLLERYEQS